MPAWASISDLGKSSKQGLLPRRKGSDSFERNVRQIGEVHVYVVSGPHSSTM